MIQPLFFMRSAPKDPEVAEIVIIGAGPAGLACAEALRQLNIDSIILESGECTGYSWTQMPDNLQLGPWISTQIDRSTSWLKLYKSPFAKDFSSYLQNFAIKNQLDVKTNQKVQSIKMDNGHFFLTTTNPKSFKSSCVINATGYFGSPCFPEWIKKIPNSCKTLHYNDYKNSDFILSSRLQLKILIVGGGISAGELLLDLVNSKHDIYISTKSIIKFEKPKWVQLLISPFYFWLEDKISSSKYFGSSKRHMAGGKIKRILKSKRITNIGPILDIKKDLFYHSKGSEHFDLVLFATGWKCNLSHLPAKLLNKDGQPLIHGFQSKLWPGFFFLGIDNLISYRSRFIRGIRNDAKDLAKIILNYLENKKENSRN